MCPVRTNGWCDGMLHHSACTFVLDLAMGWQTTGKQEDMPSCNQETKTTFSLLASDVELEA